MNVEELGEADENEVTTLWAEAGSTRPWNVPPRDFRQAVEGPTSAVLGLREESELVGTVMVGFDGHRGWIYFLAVKTQR